MTTDLHKPDYTTDSDVEYKTAIDEGFQNVGRTAWSFAPHPASPTPDMTIDLNPGAIWDGSALIEKAQQTTSTFTAPSVNPRIDRVVVDATTGTYSIVAGAEDASPVAPAIPADKFPICQIEFATTTTSIGYVATSTVAAIVDERIPFTVAGASISDFVARGTVDGTGTPSITESTGVDSVADSGTGIYTITLSETMATTTYTVVVGGGKDSGDSDGRIVTVEGDTMTTTTFIINVETNNGTLTDSPYVTFAVFGSLA